MTVNVSVTADSSIALRGEEGFHPNRILAAAAPSNAPTIGAVLDDVGGKQGVIEHGGYTDDGRPQIVGKAVAGTVVYLYDGLELMGRVTVDASGEWSISPRLPLRDGEHVLSVIHEYPDGDVSDASAPYVIYVDQVAPSTPIILGAEDDEGRITGAIVNEGITDDNRPTIEGITEANATIIVYDKGKEIGSAQADATGKWSFTPEPPLADGTHILEYVAMDRAGNQSEKSGTFEFLVDTRPELTNIDAAEDNVGSITGTLMSGSLTDDATPTLRGTATAGGIVKIYEGAVLLGQTTAGVDGRWTFTPATPLSEGLHAFQATVTLVAKGESERSPSFHLTIDHVVPEAPSIEEIIDNVGSQQGVLVNGAATDDNTPTLKGRAEAGCTVTVYDNGSVLGTAVADVAGDWTLTPDRPLPDGVHTFTAVAEDKTGNVGKVSEPYAVNIDTVPPPQTATLIGIGKDSGSSANDFLTNDGSAGRLMTGKLSASLGVGEALQVSTDGGRTWATALVTGDRWAVQDGNSHASDWAVHTRVIDAAGNAGATSTQAIALDTTPPAAPTSMSISGSQATVMFNKAEAEVGARISLTQGEKRYEHVLTAADVAAGRVVINAPFALASQTTVAFVDKAGNMSTESLRESSLLENFDTVTSAINLPTGAAYKLGNLTFYSLSSSGDPTNYPSGYTSAPYTYPQGLYPSTHKNHMNQKPTSSALWVAGSIRVSLDNGLFGDKLSFSIGDNNLNASLRLYAEDGSLVHSTGIASVKGTVAIDLMANGKSFSWFEVTTSYNSGQKGNDQLWIDNIQISGASKISTPGLYTLTSDTVGGLRGDGAANVFLVSKVVDLADSSIDGNGGIDTLKLSGANQTLDLVALGAKVTSMEIIDLTGAGNNTLTLGLSQVLENGAVNGFYVGDKSRVQMMVKGNAGDKVNLSDLLTDGNDIGDWVKMSAVAVSDVMYDSYQHSSLGAELLVKQGVTTTLTGGVQNGYGADTVANAELAASAAMLTLNLSQVMNEGVVNLFHDDAQGRTQMMVKGNAGDSINLDDLLGDGTDLGDWAVNGTQVIDGVAYDVYQHTGMAAELLVEESVKVNLI